MAEGHFLVQASIYLKIKPANLNSTVSFIVGAQLKITLYSMNKFIHCFVKAHLEQDWYVIITRF